MTTENLIPTECDGLDTKPELTQDVRDTLEYQKTLTEPDRPALLDTLADLAKLGPSNK